MDLTTTDPESASAFYTRLFDWEAEDTQDESEEMYTMMHLDGDEACAIYDLDEERRKQDVPSH